VSSDGWVIAASGRWFSPPGGQKIELRTRKALRRLLKRLAEARVAEPGRALPVEALFEAGWTGQYMHPEVGPRRVYTAVSLLRKLGLAGALLRRDDGYLLDPAVLLLIDERG
jgi:hypothetical protein